MAGDSSETLFRLSHLDWSMLTVFIVVLMVLLTLLDTGLSALERLVQPYRHYQHMLHKIYRELMILGLISLVLLIGLEFVRVPTKPFLHFEFAHIWVFTAAVLYVVHTGVFMWLAVRTKKDWDRVLDLFADQGSQFSEQGLFLRQDPLVKLMEFHVLKERFLHAWNLPRDFDFSKYLRRSLSQQLVESMEITYPTWLMFGVFVLALLGLQAAVDASEGFSLWLFLGLSWSLLLYDAYLLLVVRSARSRLVRAAGVSFREQLPDRLREAKTSLRRLKLYGAKLRRLQASNFERGVMFALAHAAPALQISSGRDLKHHIDMANDLEESSAAERAPEVVALKPVRPLSETEVREEVKRSAEPEDAELELIRMSGLDLDLHPTAFRIPVQEVLGPAKGVPQAILSPSQQGGPVLESSETVPLSAATPGAARASGENRGVRGNPKQFFGELLPQPFRERPVLFHRALDLALLLHCLYPGLLLLLTGRYALDALGLGGGLVYMLLALFPQGVFEVWVHPQVLRNYSFARAVAAPEENIIESVFDLADQLHFLRWDVSKKILEKLERLGQFSLAQKREYLEAAFLAVADRQNHSKSSSRSLAENWEQSVPENVKQNALASAEALRNLFQARFELHPTHSQLHLLVRGSDRKHRGSISWTEFWVDIASYSLAPEELKPRSQASSPSSQTLGARSQRFRESFRESVPSPRTSPRLDPLPRRRSVAPEVVQTESRLRRWQSLRDEEVPEEEGLLEVRLGLPAVQHFRSDEGYSALDAVAQVGEGRSLFRKVD